MGYNKSKRIALALRDIENKEELKTLPRIPFGNTSNKTFIAEHPVGGKFIIKGVHGYVGDTEDKDTMGHVRKRYKHELLRSSLNNLLGIDGPQVHYLSSETHPDGKETHTLAIEHLPQGSKPLSLHPTILYSNLGTPKDKTNTPEESNQAFTKAVTDVIGKTNKHQVEKLTLLDRILKTEDRHLNNYMLSPDNKTLYSIDHEITGPENQKLENTGHAIIDSYITANPDTKFNKDIIDTFLNNRLQILADVHKHLFGVMSPETLKKYLIEISDRINKLKPGLTYGELASQHRGDIGDKTQKI